jgi:hypothetical protein
MLGKIAPVIRVLPWILIACAILGFALLAAPAYPGAFSKNPVLTAGQAGQGEAAASIRIDAAPQRYSPVMSSTPGIGLVPNVTGFSPGDAWFEWNASYGRFLDWKAPDYRIGEHGQTIVTDGNNIYWSFIAFPEAPQEPVRISVAAKDKKTGRVLCSSALTLGWEQNYTFVAVQGR